MTNGILVAPGIEGFVERSSLLENPRVLPHRCLEHQPFYSRLVRYSKGLQGQSSFVLRSALSPFTNFVVPRAVRSNPHINTDWRDKAAPAGYVER
jgi:hypothetical protein